MFEEIILNCKNWGEKPKIALLTYLWLKFIDVVGREPDIDELNVEFQEWRERYGDIDYDNLESLIYVL